MDHSLATLFVWGGADVLSILREKLGSLQDKVQCFVSM